MSIHMLTYAHILSPLPLVLHFCQSPHWIPGLIEIQKGKEDVVFCKRPSIFEVPCGKASRREKNWSGNRGSQDLVQLDILFYLHGAMFLQLGSESEKEL